MRNAITRTIVVNKVHGYTVEMNDGVPAPTPVEPVTVYGNIDKKLARKALVEKYGKDVDIFVGKIETEEKKFEISVEKFVENATEIAEDAETENDKKEVI